MKLGAPECDVCDVPKQPQSWSMVLSNHVYVWPVVVQFSFIQRLRRYRIVSTFSVQSLRNVFPETTLLLAFLYHLCRMHLPNHSSGFWNNTEQTSKCAKIASSGLLFVPFVRTGGSGLAQSQRSTASAPKLLLFENREAVRIPQTTHILIQILSSVLERRRFTGSSPKSLSRRLELLLALLRNFPKFLREYYFTLGDVITPRRFQRSNTVLSTFPYNRSPRPTPSPCRT
ncbi:hypothetical protein GALMADRAFT_148387 [Galerina marginata CBS 339.88]|uniref:CCR4-Not complex component Not1 C-terminal domain-containing protein n=1 Tax=Galerina marginata (strain CBS 339.88) TaxID=685588 RepID=A0A067SDG2_GALM3|nr:hypothetical protein GALMADRAFT_148387 [Galerina marginata CBS 339.88]